MRNEIGKGASRWLALIVVGMFLIVLLPIGLIGMGAGMFLVTVGGAAGSGGAVSIDVALYHSSKAISSYVQETAFYATNTCNLSVLPAHSNGNPTGVPTWALLLGQMMEETGGTYLHNPTDTKDTSYAGAVGPFQFLKSTWQEYVPSVMTYFQALHTYNPGMAVPTSFTRTDLKEAMVGAGEMECSDAFGPNAQGVWPWDTPAPPGQSLHAIYEAYSGDPKENCYLSNTKGTYASCTIANGAVLAYTLHVPWAIPDGNGELALILENNVGTPPVDGKRAAIMQVFMDQLAIATNNASSSDKDYIDYLSQANLWGACLTKAGQPFAPGATSAPSGMVWDFHDPTPPSLSDYATGEVVFIGTVSHGALVVDRVGMIVGHAPASPPFATTGPSDQANGAQYVWMIDGPGSHTGEGYEPVPSVYSLASPQAQSIVGICTPPGT